MTDTIGFSVGAVARRLGVAPSTLRTWNRRYGIGARDLSPGRHRRYTAEDIVRLEHMQKLILRGAAPADAARAAMAAPVTQVPGPAGVDAAGPEDNGAGGPDAGSAGAGATGKPGGVLVPGGPDGGRRADGRGARGRGSIPPARPGPGHGSGGQRLALPGASPAARGLARAVLALDEKWISGAILAALARDGSVPTWEELLLPVLSGLGTRYEHTGTCVEAEHLLSMAIIAAFSRRAADLPGQVEHRAVLLASAPGEQHSLPLYALAAALAERGIDSRMLGSDLPYSALAAAVRRTGPGVVFLWSQAPATGNPVALPDLSPRRPGARLFLGGPGWDRDRIPASARLVGTLREAVSEVVAALGY
jgi:MerR family transcriptional regulator, light-induced transcriptional regulator